MWFGWSFSFLLLTALAEIILGTPTRAVLLNEIGSATESKIKRRNNKKVLKMPLLARRALGTWPVSLQVCVGRARPQL